MKPMLATVYDKKYLSGSISVQPKLDGMRLLWDGWNIWSRNGKTIKSVPTLLEELRKNWDGFPLDGELYCHDMSFQEIISSTRRSVNILEDKRIQYHIYDSPQHNAFFIKRFDELVKRFNPLIEITTLVKTFICNPDEDSITLQLKKFEDEGYEGLIIRNNFAFYEGKRSKGLLKKKSFVDLEVLVIELQEGEGKYVGMLGAFVCCLVDNPNIIFKVGSGFTDEERRNYFSESSKNKLITIKFRTYSDGGVPKEAVFKCFRDYE